MSSGTLYCGYCGVGVVSYMVYSFWEASAEAGLECKKRVPITKFFFLVY